MELPRLTGWMREVTPWKALYRLWSAEHVWLGLLPGKARYSPPAQLPRPLACSGHCCLGQLPQGQSSSEAPQAGVPGLLWLSHPFPVLTDLPGGQDLPIDGLPPLLGGWPCAGPQAPVQMEEVGRYSRSPPIWSYDHHDTGRVRSLWGLKERALHLTKGQRDHSSLPGGGGL